MTGTATDRRWGVRSIAALLVFIIAVVLTPVALIGHWGQRTVFDSQRYIETVGPLAAQPEVQQALTQAVTDAVVAKANTEQNVTGLLDNLFPDSKLADALAAPISAGINSLIGELVGKFVASDQFQTLWIDVNKLAQKGVVRILEGDDDSVIRLQGQDVVLDISSLVTAIQQYLVDNGVSAAGNITIPETDKQIVLMQSPALQQLRFIYSLTNPILSWLPMLVAVLFALAIGLARRRARMTVAVGIGLVAAAIAIKIGMGAAENVFVDQLANTVFAPASKIFWATMFNYLLEGLNTIVLFGVAVIVFGWFGGRTASARRLRGHLVDGLGELGARLPEGLTGLGQALERGQQWVRWVIYALVVAIILSADVMSASVVVWAVALGAGLITLLQVLIGRGTSAEVDVTVEIVEIEA